MGILSWFRSLWSSGGPEELDETDEKPSLIKLRYEDPDLTEVERAAAADVARVREDDKYFGGDEEDEL